MARPHRWRRVLPQPWVVATSLALGVPVVAAPLLFAGTLDWTAIVLGLMSIVGAGVIVVAYRDSLPQPDFVVFVVFGALGWTAMQAAPLPCGLVEVLAPESAEQVGMTAAMLGTDAVCRITRDPGATFVEVAKGAGIVGAFISAYVLSYRERRRDVLVVLGISGAALALVTVAHLTLQANAVYGVHTPLFTPNAEYGPFLNPNPLSGAMLLAFPILVALAIEVKRARVLLLVLAALCVGINLVALSRGGIVGLGVALGLGVCAVYRAQTKRNGTSSRESAVLAGGLLVAITLGAASAGYAGLVAAVREVGSDDTKKVALVGDALEYAVTAPWLGVGRGAFSVAFVEHRGQFSRAEHAENFIAQWVTDWGPVALLLIGYLLFRVLRSAVSSGDPKRLGLAVGVLTLTIQNLVDFGLELPGIAIPAAAALGALVTPTRSEGTGRSVSSTLTARSAWGAPVVTALALVVLVTPAALHSDRRILDRDLTVLLQTGRRAEFDARLRRALSLHPSEPSFFLLGASERARRDDPETLRWLNRSMVLAPGWSSPHIEAARYLLRKRRFDQAMLELRAAARNDSSSVLDLICATARARASSELLLRAAPATDRAAAVINRASHCALGDGVQRTLDAWLLEHAPDHPDAYVRTADRLAQQGRADEAERLVRRGMRRMPDEPKLSIAMAGLFVRRGEPNRAVGELDTALRARPRDQALLEQLARTQAAAHDAEGMRETMSRHRAVVGSSPAAIASSYVLLARLEVELGNDGAAVGAFEHAIRLHETEAALTMLASLTERLGDLSRARGVYARLVDLVPTNVAYRTARERLSGSSRTPERTPLERQQTHRSEGTSGP